MVLLRKGGSLRKSNFSHRGGSIQVEHESSDAYDKFSTAMPGRYSDMSNSVRNLPVAKNNLKAMSLMPTISTHSSDVRVGGHIGNQLDMIHFRKKAKNDLAVLKV